ncbi:MAG: hypothetical protein HKN23_05070 [Verrucomicrobiales bacterium]|nr:hypothetical protein [Verrucomicrobiales bacterium]
MEENNETDEEKGKDKKSEGFFFNIGRSLGYLNELKLSVPGLILLLVGIIGTIALMYTEGDINRSPMTGTGLAVTACLVSGAFLQVSKRKE